MQALVESTNRQIEGTELYRSKSFNNREFQCSFMYLFIHLKAIPKTYPVFFSKSEIPISRMKKQLITIDSFLSRIELLNLKSQNEFG